MPPDIWPIIMAQLQIEALGIITGLAIIRMQHLLEHMLFFRPILSLSQTTIDSLVLACAALEIKKIIFLLS